MTKLKESLHITDYININGIETCRLTLGEKTWPYLCNYNPSIPDRLEYYYHRHAKYGFTIMVDLGNINLMSEEDQNKIEKLLPTNTGAETKSSLSNTNPYMNLAHARLYSKSDFSVELNKLIVIHSYTTHVSPAGFLSNYLVLHIMFDNAQIYNNSESDLLE